MKAPPRRIVCATDFSANCRSAADVAAAVGVRLNATVVLVHVADEAHAFAERSKELKAFLQRVRIQLRKEAARVRRAGVTVEEVLLHGKWAEEAIAEFLEKDPPLLVLVSAVSKTAFDRWTLGSVSESITQRSVVPTLVVRASERLLGWARGDRALNVVVAVDFTVSSDAALSWIGELRKIGECAVTVAHIYWPPDAYRWLPPHETLSLTRIPPSVQRRLVRDLQKKVEALVEGGVGVKVEPNWGRPDAALVSLALEGEADLIVVGTHQRHGLQRLKRASVSRGVVRHAPMSVACVPIPPALAHGVGLRPRVGRVLVATDFSPTGDRAVPWAVATLEAGGVVKLLHVIPPEAPSKRRGARGSARTRQQRRAREAREKLLALVPPGLADSEIAVEVEVLVDRLPARAIGKAVRAFGADVICLGSQGHSVLAETVLGSVARAVVLENAQPVLLVRPADR